MITTIKEFSEVVDNESDRGAVLVCAAFLDNVLRLLIASFLVDDDKQAARLLGSEKEWNRPLGTFGAKIITAYCLGLISQDEFHDLGIVQRLRNEFAHQEYHASFADQQTKNRCDSLKLPQRLPKHISWSARRRFVFAAGTLSISLGSRARQAKRERCQVPPESTALQWEE